MGTLRRTTTSLLLAATFLTARGVCAAAAGSASPSPPGTAGSPTTRGAAPTAASAPTPPTAPPRPRSLAPYFAPATPGPKPTDPDGFIQRWLLLEPIKQSIRSNAVFIDSYCRKLIKADYFPGQFTAVPRDGDRVTVAGEPLAWHALDSADFNVKVFRFAYGLDRPTYGVMFWAVTVVDSPVERRNVRLAVGSNSASIWWVNGKEAVDLFGDRRMGIDDCASRRLTLNKGPNVIRGAVLNGPGLSDFCARFLDESGQPLKGLAVTLDVSLK